MTFLKGVELTPAGLSERVVEGGEGSLRPKHTPELLKLNKL